LLLREILEEIRKLNPAAIIISPGPCTPKRQESLFID